LERGEATMEYRAVRPDGGVRWLEARGVAFYDAAGRPDRLVGVCADVTEDRRADVRVAFLGEIARSSTSSLHLATVPRRAVAGSDAAAIMLRDAGSGIMVPRHRIGLWWRDWDTLRVTPGRGLGGLAMETGRPQRTEDYRADPRVPAEFRALTEEAGTMALMVVPVLVGAEAAGLLYISNRTPRHFTDEDETICVRLAEPTAVAGPNAHPVRPP